LCKIEFIAHRNSFYWKVLSNNKMSGAQSLYEPHGNGRFHKFTKA
jgi:hypothetical protein